jgi:hypothetical protein
MAGLRRRRLRDIPAGLTQASVILAATAPGAVAIRADVKKHDSRPGK